MAVCETIKVKPWGKDQGDHVLINADDLDPKTHELFEAETGKKPPARKKSAD